MTLHTNLIISQQQIQGNKLSGRHSSDKFLKRVQIFKAVKYSKRYTWITYDFNTPIVILMSWHSTLIIYTPINVHKRKFKELNQVEDTLKTDSWKGSNLKAGTQYTWLTYDFNTPNCDPNKLKLHTHHLHS